MANTSENSLIYIQRNEITLHYTALRCIAFSALHYITLHYIIICLKCCLALGSTLLKSARQY